MSQEFTPAVSIVLPTFNRAHCLHRAVESVLRQTFTDFELLIVDDCSTDDTDAYLGTLSDPRIRVLRHDVNKGGAAARNTGIAHAIAPIVTFQDSDDEWLVTMLQTQIDRLKEMGDEYGASYCGKIVYGRDDKRMLGPRKASYMPDEARTCVEGDIYLETLKNAVVSTQTLVVRKSILDQVGGFREDLRIGLDWELTTRIARKTKFAFVDEPLVMTFLGVDSISHRKADGPHTIIAIYEEHEQTLDLHPKLKSHVLYTIGRMYQKTGNSGQARMFLWRSVKSHVSSLRNWSAFFISLVR